MTALRTLHVIDSLGPGGAERSLVDVLEALAPELDPTVAVFGRRPDDAPLAGRVGDLRVVGGNRVARVLGLRRLIAEQRPAVVHTTLVEADLAARLAAWRTGTPVVTSLVNTTYDPVRRADPSVSTTRLTAVQKADGLTARHLTSAFHAITETVADAAVRDLGIDRARVSVIPRGRDATRLGEPSPERRAKARAELGIDAAARVVLSVGRQEFQKGLDVLVQAAALLGRADTVVLHAGRSGAAVLDHDAGVRFLGHREDVPDLLAAADVFAFPSRYEGLGGAVLEAMAMGLAVVASDIPVLREVLGPAGALLVPPGDPAALAGAVRRLLDDDALREDIGRRGRALFHQRYTLEAVAPRMLRFWLDAAHTVPRR